MMQIPRLARALGIAAVVTMAGCKSLDIQNPNAPDAKRALSDPASLEAVAGGTLRGWMQAYMYYPTTTLCTMARSCTASWNNDDMRIYSSIGSDCAVRCGWFNDPSAAARISIENYWTGYYSVLSSSNDVLNAIRTNHIVITDAATTKRSETIAQLMQGETLAEIALNYDKGYIVDETTDISNLVYSDRKALRTTALAKLDAAIALANANAFTTPAGWTNGTSYTNTQIARIANTMAARLIAYWPRNAAENAQADWARVVSYASKGMSTGGAFDFVFTGDGCNNWCPESLTWFDDMTSGRVHTRLAHMLDPVTQTDPWPEFAGGNPPPNSPDKRLGDGSFGNASMVAGYGTIPKTAKAGTDFAWSSQAGFRPSRGQYHQSNIAFVRWDCDGQDDGNSIGSGYCPYPVFMAAQNDLLWAEGLIRSGGDLGLAATLINNSRVKRGGLAPATAADGAAGLQTKLYYEQEIELFALSATPYYNNRRIDNLITGTPHEMPVPAKELGVFGQALYTFGGTGALNSPTPP